MIHQTPQNHPDSRFTADTGTSMHLSPRRWTRRPRKHLQNRSVERRNERCHRPADIHANHHFNTDIRRIVRISAENYQVPDSHGAQRKRPTEPGILHDTGSAAEQIRVSSLELSKQAATLQEEVRKFLAEVRAS